MRISIITDAGGVGIGETGQHPRIISYKRLNMKKFWPVAIHLIFEVKIHTSSIQVEEKFLDNRLFAKLGKLFYSVVEYSCSK